jgi:hypothetical protein
VPGSHAGVIQAGTLSKTDVGVVHTMFVGSQTCLIPMADSCRNLLHPISAAYRQGCHTAGTPGADSSAGAHAVLDEALRYCQGVQLLGRTLEEHGSLTALPVVHTSMQRHGLSSRLLLCEVLQASLIFTTPMQVHMAELNKAGTRLDAARRQFYLKSQKHLKEHVAKKDNTAAPPPREDSDAALSG